MLLILNGLGGLLTAQSLKLLRGSVRDTLGKPVPFATLVTQKTDSSTILTFGNTDSEGRFQLNSPSLDRFVLKVASLGFETKILWIESKNIDKSVDIVLNYKGFVLKEAVVTASSKVVERGDTTTFKADAFRDSTERNLEQLLAKIPGIDVNKNTGVITVQGKAIKKILIEGDDLTGRNYQLLSQNMAADIVDKIQIIDRFNDNRLLKGLKKTDDKVINITLKDNRKSLLFGNATLGFGNDWRTDNNVNLLTIGKRIKMINLGSFNTIGVKSTATQIMNTEFGEETELQQQRTLLSNQNQRFINIDRQPAISLGTQSIQFNQSVLGSSNFILRPLDKLSVKGQLTFSQDKLQFFTENQTKYILPDSVFSLNQRDTTTNRPIVFVGKIETQWDISSKSMLHVAVQFQKTKLSTKIGSVVNEQFISNDLNDKNVAMQAVLDFTHRISEHKALTINSLWIENTNTQDLMVNQTNVRHIPLSISTTNNEAFYQFTQSIEKPIRFIANSVQLFSSNQNIDVNISGGIVLKTENLQSNLQINSFNLLDKRFINNTVFEQRNYFIGLNLNKNFKQSRLFFNTSSGYYNQILKDSKFTKNGFYALPTCGYQWKKGKKSLFFTYGFNFLLPQFADITAGYIITDYRNIMRGSSVLIPASSNTFITNYNYGKFEDRFMGNISSIVSIQQGGYRPDLTVSPDFEIASKTENIFSTNSLQLSSRLEYYSSDVYLRFKLKPSIGISQYQNALNGSDIRLNQLMNTAMDFSIRSAYLKWFNFSLGGNLGFSRASTNVSEKISINENKSLGSYLDFQLRLGKHITSKIDNEFFTYKQAQSQTQNYFFSNLSIDFNLSKSKVELSFVLKNIFNTKSFVSNSVSDYLISNNRIRLLPRYFLINGTFKF